MAAALWGSIKVIDLFILDTTRTLNLIILFVITSSIGFLAYILTAAFLKTDELNDYFGYLKRIKV